MIDGEELDFYIAARGETMSLWTKLYLMINVLHGLRHLLEYSTIHLDLKPINIMVCAGLITKIIDYGEAYHRDVCPKSNPEITQITRRGLPSPMSLLKCLFGFFGNLQKGRTLCNSLRNKTSSHWGSSYLRSSSALASST